MSETLKNKISSQHENQNSPSIYLITPEEFEKLPNGTKLIDIFGKEFIKGKHEIDTKETRCGYLPIGFLRNTKPQNIQLDLDKNRKFTIYQQKNPSKKAYLPSNTNKPTKKIIKLIRDLLHKITKITL